MFINNRHGYHRLRCNYYIHSVMAVYNIKVNNMLIILILEKSYDVLNYNVYDIINLGALQFGVALVPKQVAIFIFRRP